MEQPLNQLGSPPNNLPFIPVVISVILTAIIFGGGTFWWMNQKQQVVNNEVVSLHNQLDQLEAYEARQTKIAELKANPQLTVDNIYDLFEVISFSERRDLFDSARKAVVKGSGSGIQFSLVFNWKKGNWVLFSVIPENVETDIAGLFLEKVDGRWKAHGPGTAFPDLWKQHPELFE